MSGWSSMDLQQPELVHGAQVAAEQSRTFPWYELAVGKIIETSYSWQGCPLQVFSSVTSLILSYPGRLYVGPALWLLSNSP